MRRLLMPIVVLTAAVIVDRLGWWGNLPAPVAAYGGRAVLAVAFLLAWRFQRGRLAWAAVALTTRRELQGPPGGEAAAALMVILPLTLAALGPARDWKVASRAGLWRWMALAVPVLASLAVARWAPNLIPAWAKTPLELSGALAGLGRGGLTAAGLGSMVLSAAVLMACVAWRRTPVEAGLFGAVIALFLARSGDGSAMAFHLAAGGLILTLALVENAFSLAFEDGLTGLPARRALEETLVHLGGTYAIAMVDLDHFKKFNDRHGHEVGDQVLQMVASRLARVGSGGRAFRYGGEEFSVVFDGKSVGEAEPALDELRRAIAGASFAVRSPLRPKKKPKKGGKAPAKGSTTKKLRVTVSVGVAERSSKNRLPEEVMKAADKALYRAKRAGRNRVMVGR